MMLNKIIYKYKSLSTIVKATLWFSLISFIQKGVAALTTPIFTRLMSIEQYGMYSIYMSWYNIFSIICTFNISIGIFNTLVIKEPEKQDNIASSVIGFEFFTTIITTIIYIILFLLIGNLGGISFELGIIMFLEIFFNIPILIWVSIQKINYSYKKSFIVIVSELLLSTILSIFLVIISDNKVIARIAGIVITYLFFGLIIFISIFRKCHKLYDKEIWKILFLKGSPLIIHYLSQAILSQADRLMIDNMLNEEATAIYSLAHQLAWLLSIIVTAVNSTFVPWMYRKIKKCEYNNISKVSIIGLIILGILTLMASIFSPELLRIYGGEGYVVGKELVPILSSSILIIYVYGLFVNVELYFKDTKKTVFASIIGGICNIVLNVFFIDLIGINGAAIATLISYLLILLCHYYSSKKILKNNGIKLRSLFNIKIIFIITLIFLTFNILAIFIFDYLLARCFIAGILLILFLIFLKKIIRFLSNGNKEINN